MKQKIREATDTVKELIGYYLMLIMASGIVFHWAEHKKIGDSIWWAFVTAMTVGYGDIYPITAIGRIEAVILMHIVPLILVPLLIIRMMTNVIEDKNQFTHEEQETIKKDISEIKNYLTIVREKVNTLINIK